MILQICSMTPQLPYFGLPVIACTLIQAATEVQKNCQAIEKKLLNKYPKEKSSAVVESLSKLQTIVVDLSRVKLRISNMKVIFCFTCMHICWILCMHVHGCRKLCRHTAFRYMPTHPMYQHFQLSRILSRITTSFLSMVMPKCMGFQLG